MLARFFCLTLFILVFPPSLIAQTTHEFRGAWIPSVFNLCFPSKAGLSAEVQKTEIVQLLNVAQSMRLNAVFFQVRPECDALYSSNLEPWSRYLMGQQGDFPGYDPLAFMISEAKKRNIGVHAWFNPFRAAASAGKPLAESHLVNKLSSVTYQIDSTLWMDPGNRAVQDQIVRVVLDVVSRYDIAGVHLDDYFYPYPSHPPIPVVFPDTATYQAYLTTGGQLNLGDWRRSNVNQLIHRLSLAIKTIKPGVIFGVSPFGVYRPDIPKGVDARLDQFGMLYADPVKWMQEGWVDYLAPQLYWPDHSEQSFSALLAWWRDPRVNPRGLPIYPGLALERLEPPFDWAPQEILHQIALTRQIKGANQTSTGFIFWQLKSLQMNIKGIRTALEANP